MGEVIRGIDGEGLMNEFTYAVKKKCPICGEETQVVKLKARLMMDKTDEDFCVHYKGIRTSLYYIWVCEHCSFAADEKTFGEHFPDRKKDKILAFVAGRKPPIPFSEERTERDAEIAFMLAIFYAQLTDETLAKQAGLYLHWAWVYRETGNEKKEMRALESAARLYEQSVMKERYPIGNMTDNMATFMSGVIYYRMKDIERATPFLSRLMGDKNLRADEPKLFEKVRDLWQTIREENPEAGK